MKAGLYLMHLLNFVRIRYKSLLNNCFQLKNNTTDVHETEHKMYNWTPIFEQVLI